MLEMNQKGRSYLPSLGRRRLKIFLRFLIALVLCVTLLTVFMMSSMYSDSRLLKTLHETNQHLSRRLVSAAHDLKEKLTRGKYDPTALFNIPAVPKNSRTDFVPALQPSVMGHFLKYEPKVYNDTLVILSPIHNVERNLPAFVRMLTSLTYPHELISVAFGEDCSKDRTLSVAKDLAKDLRSTFKNVDVFHFNISGQVGGSWNEIHNSASQLRRRGHLAKSRNLLLKSGLKDQKWVLWIDSDISYLPPDIIQQLMSSEKDIVVPACLYSYDGRLRVFDKNTWRETSESIAQQKGMPDSQLMLEGYGISSRLYLTDLRAEGRVVPIDGVGGCTLLIRADYHHSGLIFPETILDHHIETEGLAKLAKKMGYGVYGMPFVEVLH